MITLDKRKDDDVIINGHNDHLATEKGFMPRYNGMPIPIYVNPKHDVIQSVSSLIGDDEDEAIELDRSWREAERHSFWSR